jgi:hypothetical protein
MMMNKYLILFCAMVLLSITACKKVCYQCTQYCAYCVNKNDSAIAYKICANNIQGEGQIDVILTAYQDSGYTCNLLNQQIEICDNKNAINGGVTYYEQENYFCNPQ